MKKKLLILSSVMSVGFILSGCGSTGTTSSIEASSSLTSDSASSSESVGSSATTSNDIVSSSTSIESVASSETVSLTGAESIYEKVQACINGSNYTMSYTDADGTFTRKYTPNAYYNYAPEVEPFTEDIIGYAEDETGIFSYKIANGEVTEPSAYFKDTEGQENVHGLYTAKTYVTRWDELDEIAVNFAQSFALVTEASFANLREIGSTGGYQIAIDEVLPLLPPMVQQGFTSESVSRISLVEGNMVITYHSSYSDVDLTISDIGTTTIPEIEAYLDAGNGGGDGSESTLKDDVKNLFATYNYRMQFSENTNLMRYVTPLYTFNSLYVEATDSISEYGLIEIPENNTLGLTSEVHDYTIANGEVVLGGVSADKFLFVKESYELFPESFVDLFEVQGNKLVSTSENLYNHQQRFSPTLDESCYIGRAEMTYTPGFMGSITIEASVYEWSSMTATGETITITMDSFGESIYETENVATYLSSITTAE